MCAVLGHHQRLRLGKIKDLTARRDRCRVSGGHDSACSLRNLQAGDRRCGRIVDRAKGFPRMSLLPAGGFFDRSASCGCGAASYSARRSTAVCCCPNRSARRRPTPPPAPPARHSHGASCRFVPQAQPFLLASTAFCAISRSMLACKIATYPDVGCIGNALFI